MLERKVALTGDRNHNNRIMSLERSPLSHPGGALDRGEKVQIEKEA